jgi:spore germination cell wall hydrolase CwlJ-like protein
MTRIGTAVFRAAVCLAAGSLLSACTSAQTTSSIDAKAKSGKLATEVSADKKVYTYTSADRECLKRAMYFESKRTSENGFLAVGSVVMNRMTSGIYPSTICGVVGQEKQFAPGVMTRKMEEETAPALNDTADAVLKGARHPEVKSAMFFHQKGLRFPYRNMHYTAVAGGNEFYEKRGRDGSLQTPEPAPASAYVMVAATKTGAPTLVAASAAAPATNTTSAEAQATQTANAAPTVASAASEPASAASVTASAGAPAPLPAPAPASASVMQAYQPPAANASEASAAILSAADMPGQIPLPKRRPAGAKGDLADMVMVAPAFHSPASRSLNR